VRVRSGQYPGEMVDAAHVADIVRAGLLAPSGDNCQPWRFSWNGHQLDVQWDRERAESFYDVRHIASWIALGATLANMELAAHALGLAYGVVVFPKDLGDSVVARVSLQPGRLIREPLVSAIPSRCVNRRPYRHQPLLPNEREALWATVQPFHGMHLSLLEDAGRKARVAALAARNDRLLFEHRALHDGLFRWLRWTSEATRQTGDGIPATSLELSTLERPGFRLLSSWPFACLSAAMGVTRLLPLRTQSTYRQSSAIGLLSMEGTAPEDFVKGGEVLQRLWLTATLKDLAFQPITGITFLWLRTQLLHGEGLSPHHRNLIEQTAHELHELLDLSQRTPVMVFRLGHAQAPSARALRRPLESVLTLAHPTPG